MSIGEKLDAIASDVAETRVTVARIEERQTVVKQQVEKANAALFGPRGLVGRVDGLERAENARQARTRRTRKLVMAAAVAIASTLGTLAATEAWNRYAVAPARAATPTTGPAR